MAFTNLPYGFLRQTNSPLDGAYNNVGNNGAPYTDEAEANNAIKAVTRYDGLPVHIGNDLAWYSGGVADANLKRLVIGNITSAKLLGRFDVAAGVMQEITIGSGLSLDSGTGILTASGAGTGTVTSVSVVTNQGVSGSVATATTTPAITLNLGALTGVTSINGLVITANTGVITTGTWNGTAITNAYLANSSITVNGTSIALGASGTITAANPNALTIGTGLSGTSYDGSAAVTIANTGVLSAIAGSGVSVSGATGNVTISAINNGTVTSVSVVTNQGVSGSVATATTTPAITLSLGALTGVTSINGLVITANTGVITTGTWNGTAITNAYLANSSITVNGTSIALGASGTITAANPNALTIGTGLSGTSYDGSAAVTIANTGVLSNVAGSGIGLSGATGNVTVSNTGVLSAVAGTGISVSGATGNVTINAINNGTVTSVSVVTNQGVSGSVATATTTPAITLNLGALTGVTSINGLVITANTGVITTGTWNGTAITNAYLANSSITVNGTSIALGASGTITAANPNALTIGTGLSGTSYDGSAAVTIANTGVLSAIAGSGVSVSGATGNVTISAINNGTVTSVSIVTNQGVSGSIATATTTPAITLSLGALTGVTSINGLVITANTGVITTGTWNGTAITNAYLANSSITVNGTSIALGASGTVTAAAGTLTGTTLSSGVTFSSLTSVGTITSGVWNAGAVTSSGTITGTSFSGAGTGLTGTASSLSIGGNAATATQVYVTADNTTAAYYPLAWVTGTGGNANIYASPSKILFNPSTGELNGVSVVMSGSLSAGAISGTSGAFSGNVTSSAGFNTSGYTAGTNGTTWLEYGISSGDGNINAITRGTGYVPMHFGASSFSFNADVTIVGTISATTITGTSFVKSGGTSAQFLKADGSVDSTLYQQAISINPYGYSVSVTVAAPSTSIIGDTGATCGGPAGWMEIVIASTVYYVPYFSGISPLGPP